MNKELDPEKIALLREGAVAAICGRESYRDILVIANAAFVDSTYAFNEADAFQLWNFPNYVILQYSGSPHGWAYRKLDMCFIPPHPISWFFLPEEKEASVEDKPFQYGEKVEVRDQDYHPWLSAIYVAPHPSPETLDYPFVVFLTDEGKKGFGPFRHCRRPISHSYTIPELKAIAAEAKGIDVSLIEVINLPK